MLQFFHECKAVCAERLAGFQLGFCGLHGRLEFGDLFVAFAQTNQRTLMCLFGIYTAQLCLA